MRPRPAQKPKQTTDVSTGPAQHAAQSSIANAPAPYRGPTTSVPISVTDAPGRLRDLRRFAHVRIEAALKRARQASARDHAIRLQELAVARDELLDQRSSPHSWQTINSADGELLDEAGEMLDRGPPFPE